MNDPRTPFEPDATTDRPGAPGSAFQVTRRQAIRLGGAAAGAAALGATGAHAFGSPAPATSDGSPTLATTFLGGNHTYDPEVIDVSGELGIGWGRLGVGWNRLQPRPDVPVDLDRPWFGVIPIRDTILRLRDAGLEPLIRLTNSPVWAVDRSHRTFLWNGVQWDYYEPDADGMVKRTATDPETGEILQTRMIRLGPTFPPAEVDAWKNFVDVVVSELVQPPYNVTYFQIGNEPIANAFFQGSKEEYVDKVLVPAAEVARPYGGKIVFGAMPAGQGISGLNEVLRYHDAWRSIDVLDAHYWPLEAMQWTWEEWVKPGKIPAFWQTELGSGLDDTTITSLFPRTLWWALEHGLSQDDPDKYKLFYYKVPEETRVPGVSDGEMGAALTYVDDNGALKVSRHGRMLQTLHDLLDGDDLRSLHGVQLQGDIDPGDRGRPFSLSNHEQSVEGFRVGNRAVAAVHLPCAPNMWHSDYKRRDIVHLHRVELKTQHFVQVRFRRLRSQVVNAQAVDPEGNRFDIQWTNEGGGVVVSLDPGLVINADRGFARIRETMWTFYVELELDGRA